MAGEYADKVEGVGTPSVPLGGVVSVQGVAGNGALPVTFERTTSSIFLPMAVRTSFQQDFATNTSGSGIRFVLNLSAVTATGSISLAIYDADPVTFNLYGPALLMSAPITAIGIYPFTVYPGLAAVANSVANNVVGRFFGYQIAPANGVNMTYSLSYSLIP